jgi:hypothetical protein
MAGAISEIGHCAGVTPAGDKWPSGDPTPGGCAYSSIEPGILSLSLLVLWFRLQLGCNSLFVANGAGANYLICLDGDVAERLKAAVC